MIQRVSCISIDVINADKPTASLAFLAGVCEHVGVDYMCRSVNTEMLKNLTQSDYQKLYNGIKFNDINNIKPIDSVLEKLAREIQQYQPDLILVSLFSFMQISLAEKFLIELKRFLPTVEIIAGGPGISSQTNNQTNGNYFLKKKLIDYYVLGEGDEVLANFIKGQKKQIGINSRLTLTEMWVPQIDDLDEKFIIPSYKKIDFSVYHNLEQKSNAILSINTSRGCVRACTFCDVANTWPKYRYRSGKKIAEEVLKHWQDTGISNFYITDSLINGSLKSFKDFNIEMINLKKQYPGLKDFSYNGMFIVRDKKSHNEEFFANLAAAGCESLAIGVETGSDELRFKMNKKFTNEDLEHHMEMCQKYKIRNNLLMFVAHPLETKDDFNKSLKLLEKFQKYLIDDTIIGINHAGVYSLIPDTPDWDRRHELGIEVLDVESMNINWINKSNPELTIKERILRDLQFRRRAAELRYPIPYSNRYLDYLTKISPEFVPVSD